MVQSNPNYVKARKLASEIFIMQEEITFPIDVEKLVIRDINVIFASYQQYEEEVGLPENTLSFDGKYDDAMVFTKDKLTKVVLYNDRILSQGRILWNKAHEIGHIVLEHKLQGDIEEIEANTFASQLLLPQILLKVLIKKGVVVNSDYLMRKFGLSKAASDSCIRLVNNKLNNDYDAYYDDIIIDKCKSFIDSEVKNQFTYGSFDNEDVDRSNWLNEL